MQYQLTIPKEQITYSFNENGPNVGRLFGDYWMTSEANPWIQFDLGSSRAVSGFQVQGYTNRKVTSMWMQYGKTDSTLDYFKRDDGKPQVSYTIINLVIHVANKYVDRFKWNHVELLRGAILGSA